MKKIIISFLCLFAFVNFGSATKLKAIIFADTNDGSIGTGVVTSRNQMSQFITETATALDIDDYEIDIYDGTNCNPSKLKTAISNFKCESSDIVIFSYLGHGARSFDDKSDFPQMCLATNNQTNWIPLEYVHDALVKKNPRFLLVMGDCCNKASSGVLPKVNTWCASTSTEIRNSAIAGVKKLFLETKGSVIASGCKKGQYSWYNLVEGGFFTIGFVNGFDNYVNAKSTQSNWSDLFKNVQDWVVGFSRSIPSISVQTPIYKVNTNNTNKVEVKPEPISETDLHSLLRLTADETNTYDQRIGYASKALTYFANSDVLVDLVGRNHTTIVESKSAKDFVEHIAVAFRLKDFVIVEQKQNANGKIIYLKLNEIYVERK